MHATHYVVQGSTLHCAQKLVMKGLRGWDRHQLLEQQVCS
jgi:hypothetical protein